MMQNRLKYDACHWFMNFIGQGNKTKQSKTQKTQPQQQTVAIEKLKQLSADF